MATQQLKYEAARTFLANEALTDSGDHLNFTHSSAEFFSAYEKASAGVTNDPVIWPNGLVTPVTFIVNAVNDTVSWPAFTAYVEGVEVSVSAGTDTVTRGASAYMIASVHVDSSGTVTITEGTADAAAIDTTARGGSGQPPLVPVDEAEVGWATTSSTTPAPFTAAELRNVQGESMEMWNFPTFETKYSRVTNGAIGKAGCLFSAALPLIHVGATAKKVWCKNTYEPVFANWRRANDFTPPATAITVTSTPSYDGPVSSDAATIGGGSFNWLTSNSVTDPEWAAFSEKENRIYLWFKHFPNKLKTGQFTAVQAAATGAANNPQDGPQTVAVTLASKDGLERVFA